MVISYPYPISRSLPRKKERDSYRVSLQTIAMNIAGASLEEQMCFDFDFFYIKTLHK
jgi:hypothetical protein